ncbi:hypothetical protein [Sharpea azabuensis]|uniref:hypothetical protein n=1 Tax=Sharpea azabuensis TaxID=322505 RepID=UPI00156AC1A5|nr:hypothetical protein [Sharpea azabuensis]
MQYGPTVDIETYKSDSIFGCHCVNKTVLDEILSISDDIKAFYDIRENTSIPLHGLMEEEFQTAN